MIDSHTHLTNEPIFSALPSVLAHASAAGVTAYVVPAYNRESSLIAAEIAASQHNVFFAPGFHPLFIPDSALPFPDDILLLPHCVAIGEIGLDYSSPDFDRPRQLYVFNHQLALAQKHNLPAIIHCRRAFDDLLPLCREFSDVPCVLHSCSCSHEQVKPFLDLGCYIGFSGVITRARARKVVALAEFVPADRILTETDSPFIGTARNKPPTSSPANIPEIVAALAHVKNIPFNQMAELTTRNAIRFFRLPF